MIAPDQAQGSGLPDGMAYTQLVTQRHLDECSMAIGRSLWAHEVKILDEMMRAWDDANAQLQAKGMPAKMRSLDELVHLFAQRVKLAEEKKTKVYAQLGEVANRAR